MIARHIACEMYPGTIRMVANDPRMNCPAQAAHGPVLEISAHRPGNHILVPYGFLPYPHKTQTSSGLLSLAA
jgi:hypothetical protein